MGLGNRPIEDLPLGQLPSRTSIEDLPLDISLNILKKLPITTLLSFKLASKACYNLATHPLLTPHHQNNNPSCLIILPLTLKQRFANHLYLMDTSHICDEEIDIRGGEKIPRRTHWSATSVYSILSSNGLLCFLFCTENGSNHRVSLYNPLTSEHSFLPDPKFLDNNVNYSQVFGFGFDSRTREYKLVRIVERIIEHVSEHKVLRSARVQRPMHNNNNKKPNKPKVMTIERNYYTSCLQVEVLTLGKNRCRRFTIDEPFFYPEGSSDVVVGNAIHWLCKKKTANIGRSHVRDESCIIVSFDLSQEKFQRVSNPHCLMWPDCSLSVLGGCLAVVKPNGGQVDIWQMKEYGVKKSWTKEFVIKESFPVTLEEHGLMMIHPLCLLNSGKILVLYKDEALFSYDPKEECFEAIDVSRLVKKQFKAICHTPTLVSPNF